MSTDSQPRKRSKWLPIEPLTLVQQVAIADGYFPDGWCEPQLRVRLAALERVVTAVFEVWAPAELDGARLVVRAGDLVAPAVLAAEGVTRIEVPLKMERDEIAGVEIECERWIDENSDRPRRLSYVLTKMKFIADEEAAQVEIRDSNMMSASIPTEVADYVETIYGAEGKNWLKQFPALLDACLQRWSLVPTRIFPDLSQSYVTAVIRADGQQAVLKIGYPPTRLSHESEILRLFDGRGAVQLLEFDPDSGALLVERAVPGTPLAFDEPDAMAIASRVAERLWRPMPGVHGLPTVSERCVDWGDNITELRRLAVERGLIEQAWVLDEAADLLGWLLTGQEPLTLLHGSFTHRHILSARREPWLAIDPNGLVGERAFDAGTLLRDLPLAFIRDHDAVSKAAWIIDQLGDELALDRERIRAWGLVRAVMVASSPFPVPGWQPWSAVAGILAQVKLGRRRRSLANIRNAMKLGPSVAKTSVLSPVTRINGPVDQRSRPLGWYEDGWCFPLVVIRVRATESIVGAVVDVWCPPDLRGATLLASVNGHAIGQVSLAPERGSEVRLDLRADAGADLTLELDCDNWFRPEPPDVRRLSYVLHGLTFVAGDNEDTPQSTGSAGSAVERVLGYLNARPINHTIRSGSHPNVVASSGSGYLIVKMVAGDSALLALPDKDVTLLFDHLHETRPRRLVLPIRITGSYVVRDSDAAYMAFNLVGELDAQEPEPNESEFIELLLELRRELRAAPGAAIDWFRRRGLALHNLPAAPLDRPRSLSRPVREWLKAQAEILATTDPLHFDAIQHGDVQGWNLVTDERGHLMVVDLDNMSLGTAFSDGLMALIWFGAEVRTFKAFCDRCAAQEGRRVRAHDVAYAAQWCANWLDTVQEKSLLTPNSAPVRKCIKGLKNFTEFSGTFNPQRV